MGEGNPEWPKGKGMKHDIWTTVLDIISRLVVGYVLARLSLHVSELKRHKREQERKERESSIQSTKTAGTDKHSRSAAAGKGNGVDRVDARDSDDSNIGRGGRLRD